MANFDADTLRELRDVQEVVIRTEKHSKSEVVIWVVVADEEVFVRSWRGTKVQGSRGGRARHAGVCRPPAGSAGDPGERPRRGRPGQPRVPEKVPAKHPRAGDGPRQDLADHTAARTALTGSALFASR